MTRRKFIILFGSFTALPLATHAQQVERRRRVGVLFNLAADNPEAQARFTAFAQSLQELGWTDRRNIQIDVRWAPNGEKLRSAAAELVALSPDVIVANANPTILVLKQATNSVPIVFAASSDPVGAGLIESLARPGGNATGFTSAEYGQSAKWLELLKEIAPAVTHVGLLLDPKNIGALTQFAATETVASTFRVELSRIGLSDVGQIERAVATTAATPNGGLIVSRTAEALNHRELIITLAARHRLPTVYPLRIFVDSGGLVSYGPDIVDSYRHAAGYVDRILKGEKPADLPVQTPTKYELVINLRTAKALGLNIPDKLLAAADEVIE